MGGRHDYLDVNARLMKQVLVNRSTGCWEWHAQKVKGGYGRTRYKTRRELAHRVFYQLANGPIPPTLEVRHTCDNASCVNPKHLLVGTHLDNMEDAVSRNRMAAGESHPKAKLTVKQIKDIHKRYSQGEGVRSLGRLFGVVHGTVSAIVHRRIWRNVA